MREKELAPLLKDFEMLPKDIRQMKLQDPREAEPPRRRVPNPPKNGLVLRGYCTYIGPGKGGTLGRAKQFYYKQNPNAWAVETQSDMLWLTEAEKLSLVPKDPSVGDQLDVAAPIRNRFFCTIGIDYMEGSVNALPARSSALTLTVEQVSKIEVVMRLDGYAKLGKAMTDKSRTESRTRGSELRVLGYVTFDHRKNDFTRFDIVGVGKAWGNKMNYVRRAISSAGYPWMYGIACNLVTTDTPMDRIPPYNMLHYNGVGKYFQMK